MRRLLLCVLCVFCLLGVARSADDFKWDEVSVKGIRYVTFHSFCKFYEFYYPKNITNGSFVVTGPYGTVEFFADSRIFFFNGVKYWLSFPLMRYKNDELLLSKIDLIKLLEPLLRPDIAKPNRPVLGVIIDAGHGGEDKGANEYGILEKDLNLDTAFRLREALRREGLPSVLTREKDVFIPLDGRPKVAEEYPAYVFVSLHYNSAGRRTACGVETYCMSPQFTGSTSSGAVVRRWDRQAQPGNKNDVGNLLLAAYIHRELAMLYPVEEGEVRNEDGDRGVNRARFMVLRLSPVPAVLVEGGYMSNRSELNLLKTPERRQLLADSVAKGVRKFADMMNKTSGPIEQVPVFRFRDGKVPMKLRAKTDEDWLKVKPEELVDMQKIEELEKESPPSDQGRDAYQYEDGRDYGAPQNGHELNKEKGAEKNQSDADRAIEELEKL